MMYSRPVGGHECCTCDFWLGNRDLKLGKKEVLCAPRGMCPYKRMNVENNFRCGNWKIWSRIR